MKLKQILMIVLLTATVSSGTALAVDTDASRNPTAVNVTIYKTEICGDTACTTVLDDSAGVSADLVSGSSAFGENPSVAVGSYNRFRFTLANRISFTGDPCHTGSAITDFLIDDSKVATDLVSLAFATVDAGPAGATGWYANGSDANPLLMSAPLVVEADSTTHVTLRFNTAGTLSCVAGTTAELAPPTFSVTSTVETLALSTFTGGDYWLIGMSQHTPWLMAESDYAINSITSVYPTAAITAGDMIEPGLDVNGDSIYEALLGLAIDGPKYHAQIRARTIREIGWGMKVRFTAPDTTGAGTADVYRDSGQHRHSIQFGNDRFAAAPTVDSVTPTETVNYQIDARNRLTIFFTNGDSAQGAFSTDYETLIVAQMNDGLGLTMGVKVANNQMTLPNALYAWNNYMLEINRDDTATADGENGDESLTAYFMGAVGWIDLISSPGDFSLTTIGSRLRIDNPDSTSPTLNATLADETDSGVKSDVIGPFIDGAGFVGPQMDNWMAVSSSGEVAIMASSADYDLRFSDDSVGGIDVTYANHYRHNQSYALLLELATPGTHTPSSLAGTYFLSGMWDSYDSGTGNSSFGIDIGEVVLKADGTGSFSFKNMNHLQQTGTDTGLLNWRIRTVCIGLDGSLNRLDIDDTICTGGKLVDIVEAVDPFNVNNTYAILFISTSGKVLTYVDPENLSIAGANRRSLGNAVRLK